MVTKIADHNIYIGMGGWDLPPFQGKFYPKRTGRGFRKLEYYSRFFDFVELNATFYKSTFTPANVRHWLDDVAANDRFTFSVKLFQGFTHTGQGTAHDLHNMLVIADAFTEGKRFEGFVMQFPYSFSFSQQRVEQIAALKEALQPFTVFLDVRNGSWHSSAMLRFFAENKIHLINLDLPKIKNHFPFLNQSLDGLAYYRLMGRNAATWDAPYRAERNSKTVSSDRYSYDYSEEELLSIVKMLGSIRPKPLKSYVVFHNDPEANSAKNGFQIRKILEPKSEIVVPATLKKTFDALKDYPTGGATEPVDAVYTLFDKK